MSNTEELDERGQPPYVTVLQEQLVALSRSGVHIEILHQEWRETELRHSSRASATKQMKEINTFTKSSHVEAKVAKRGGSSDPHYLILIRLYNKYPEAGPWKAPEGLDHLEPDNGPFPEAPD